MNSFYSQLIFIHFRLFVIHSDHGIVSDPGCVLNFLQDINARQEQLMNEGVNPVSFFKLFFI